MPQFKVRPNKSATGVDAFQIPEGYTAAVTGSTGTQSAGPGDYVVMGKGSLQVISKDAFETMYQQVKRGGRPKKVKEEA